MMTTDAKSVILTKTGMLCAFLCVYFLITDLEAYYLWHHLPTIMEQEGRAAARKKQLQLQTVHAVLQTVEHQLQEKQIHQQEPEEMQKLQSRSSL